MIAMEQERRIGASRMLYLLKEDQIRHYWPQVFDALRATNLYEFWTAEQLFDRCVGGAMQLWALSDGEIRMIILTDITSYSNGVKTFRFLGAVGEDLDEFWKLATTSFGKIVRKLECTRVEVVGREGWGRMLRELGFQHSYSVFTLDLGKPETEN